MANFMIALMEAVSKDQNTLSQMQITDSKSTMLATKIEENIYQYWNAPATGGSAPDAKYPYPPSGGSPLAKDEWWIKYYAYRASQGDKNAGSDVTQWQTQYSEDSSNAQGAESQQDGAVQSGQGQTSADASNLQMKAQMVQGINGIQSALSNMLGRITA